MLFPIRMIVKARSYLSIIRKSILGMVFPSSASTCILNLLQQAMEVSAPEKKKCKIINRIMIIHDIAGSGINKPLPFWTNKFGYILYHINVNILRYKKDQQSWSSLFESQLLFFFFFFFLVRSHFCFKFFNPVNFSDFALFKVIFFHNGLNKFFTSSNR